ncbi:APC family permease [Mycoplasmopsis caviae]|uniref:APC family permease n=1 Tax=Mycoplasmopsis caviae TaxID=55603 RepID=A0A3P8K885_9BACT|nr:APC family permease [Mycoplasmopsis caviae]UUD35705.1 APC family permease [Mycoplasmopsis caviae]VDR41549.1 Serine/threonine exchanger SteT [Mycoplasmopsis caviae]
MKAGQNSRKIGFFFALTMLIGSVVGIGIFFKNHSIKEATSGDGLSWLMTWVLAGIISLCSALSFSEISRIKNTKASGISNWAAQLGGKAFGYFINFNYTFLYGAILIVALSFFSAEALHNFIEICANGAFKIPTYYLPFSALVIFVFFFSMMVISLKISSSIQKIVTILKFIPLIFAIIIGISLYKQNYAGGSNAFNKVNFSWSSVKGLLVALPFALFAYDAFLSVGSVANNLKKDTLPLIVIIGMSAVIVTYSLIAVSAILHNSGLVEQIIKNTIDQSKNNKLAQSLTITFNLFLFISAIGVLNGVTTGFVYELNNAINLKIILGGAKYRSKMNLKRMIVFLISIIYGIIWIIISSTVWVLKGDNALDGLSNLPTFIFFNFYAVIIILYLRKRKNINVKKMNSVLFWLFSILAIIGSLFTNVAYIWATIAGILNNDRALSGIFYGNETLYIGKWVELVFYFVYWIFIIVFPLINYYLIKKFEQRNVLDEFDLINYKPKYLEDIWSNYNFNDSPDIVRSIDEEPKKLNDAIKNE